MSISELLRVHVPPGFKELVRDVATEHGQSLATRLPGSPPRRPVTRC